MQSLVSRWKNALSSVQEPQDLTHQSANSLKKSIDRSKKKLNHSNHNDPKQLRISETPVKKKKNLFKENSIESCLQEILKIWEQKNIEKVKNKIKDILEQLWKLAKGTITSEEQSKNEIIKEITIPTASKQYERLYHDLEKKYMESEKEKQYLKNKVETIVKKYESVDQQLSKYAKIQKLIDNSLIRQEDMKSQIKKMKIELQAAQKRQLEQQKLFKKEVIAIQELVNSIKGSLPHS